MKNILSDVNLFSDNVKEIINERSYNNIHKTGCTFKLVKCENLECYFCYLLRFLHWIVIQLIQWCITTVLLVLFQFDRSECFRESGNAWSRLISAILYCIWSVNCFWNLVIVVILYQAFQATFISVDTQHLTFNFLYHVRESKLLKL